MSKKILYGEKRLKIFDKATPSSAPLLSLYFFVSHPYSCCFSPPFSHMEKGDLKKICDWSQATVASFSAFILQGDSAASATLFFSLHSCPHFSACAEVADHMRSSSSSVCGGESNLFFRGDAVVVFWFPFTIPPPSLSVCGVACGQTQPHHQQGKAGQGMVCKARFGGVGRLSLIHI